MQQGRSFKSLGLIKSGPDDFDGLILAIESFTSCGVMIILLDEPVGGSVLLSSLQ
jgi:hypothetical protein